EILEVPYPAPCRHLGVTRHREFLALLAGGLRVVGRRVAAGQDDLALGHVLARAEPEARLAGVELVASLRLLRRRQPLPLRIEPEITVAGVEEHAVALADLRHALPLHHRAHVGRRDDARALRVLGDRQTLHAAVGGRVQQHHTKPFSATNSTPRSPMPTTRPPPPRS